jgi:uncharacterized membrane protein
MKNTTISRIISVAILAIIGAFINHIDHARSYQMGREAYLAKKADYYDLHLAHPDLIVTHAIVSLILIGIYFAVYELIAFVVLKILERINVNDSNSL